jgi:hypothetical protein
MTFAGVMQIVFGVANLLFGWVYGLGAWFVGLPGALALIVVGALFIGAAGSFKQVTATQGNDVGHMMAAIGKLSTAAMLQIIAYIAAVLLGGIILVVGFFILALFAVR